MDELLLRRAQRGDSAAFEALVTPHEGMLWRICWRYMRNSEDAADCLQETMLKAWRTLPSFRGSGDLEAWLYRVCATCCLDALRRRKRTEADSVEVLHEAGYDPADGAPLPEEAVQQREEQQALRMAMDELAPEMREALVLSVLEGRSYEDVARLTGASLGTVKSRINRARGKLLEKMTRWREHPVAGSVRKDGGRA